MGMIIASPVSPPLNIVFPEFLSMDMVIDSIIVYTVESGVVTWSVLSFPITPVFCSEYLLPAAL